MAGLLDGPRQGPDHLSPEVETEVQAGSKWNHAQSHRAPAELSEGPQGLNICHVLKVLQI